MTMPAWLRSGIETFAAPELYVPMYATTDLSLIALRAFSASCAASHEPLAAVASSSASYCTVTLLILVSAIAIWIELTISTVWVLEAPVIGKLDRILTVFAVVAPPPPPPPPPHAPTTSASAEMAAAADNQRFCMRALPTALSVRAGQPEWPPPAPVAGCRRSVRAVASGVNEACSAPLLRSDDGPPCYRVRRRAVHRRVLHGAASGRSESKAAEHSGAFGCAERSDRRSCPI